MVSRFNKLTPPTGNGILLRERLFGVLDAARSRPVVWLHGPGGSGKSTLVASYLRQRDLTPYWYQVDEADRDPANLFYYLGELARLAGFSRVLPLFTPEYRQGLEIFARRFFESFFGAASPPAVQVFDDCHQADSQAFRTMLGCALREIPEGVVVFVISRSPPPRSLARMRAARSLAVIGWEELRLDLEETRQILALYGREDAVLARRLHQRVDGWVAGLVLLLERGDAPGGAFSETGPALAEEVFDYFAGELFDRAPRAVGEFLLRTALLPEMTAESAAGLTGREDAGAILEELHRRNLFTEKRLLPQPAYRYHPLFQEFLRHRAVSDLPEAELAELQRRTGSLLEKAERLSQAVQLYREGGHWPELVRLIRTRAPDLLAQGRSETLEGWLEALPEGSLPADPWLLHWQGCCLMPRCFAAARRSFAQALDLFRAGGEAAGAYLAWAAVVDTYAFELDHLSPLDDWLEIFTELRAVFPAWPDADIELRATASMFVALVLRPVRRAQIAEWAQRVERLLLVNEDLAVRIQTGFYRSAYAVWTGDLRKNAEIVGELRQLVARYPLPALSHLTVLMLEAMHGCLTGDHGACMAAVQAGLELSSREGVRAWDLLFYSCAAEGALIVGDLESSQAMRCEIEARLGGAGSLMVSFHHIHAAWVALYRDDPVTARFHLREAAPRIEWLGSPYHTALWHVGCALARIKIGEVDGIAAELAAAEAYGEKMGSRMLLFLVGLVRALAAFGRGEGAAREEQLRHALRIGREEDYRFWIWFVPDDVAELCGRALAAGIETDYARMLVRERSLQPTAAAEECAAWPWPIKILTLGRFEIRRDDAPLKFAGKVQKKPLELLKALIARGGREVGECELFDDLWPDGDPLTACKGFKTTLHRLRRLLDDDQAVQIREGRLSLNRERVWVDAWAFETLLGRAREAWQAGERGRALNTIGKALELYDGHFLPGDTHRSWSHSRRERLRERFVFNVVRAGHALREAGRIEEAVEAYRQSLEIDDRLEEIYRQLMDCYLELGRPAAVAAVYRRYETVLTATGEAPSSRLREIFRSLA